ncbi:hypothetical protein AB0L82_32355 [Nocardia sp. NPDC052001]|uniref:hypothetical protein n=1 Tax=unclassified Nocardia TaxID=2637762 RepID=UPI002E7B7489|nr:hypothetical protein [Nocardia sp. NBC_01503]WTL29945.1 hypothetical protein OHB26_23605 [Nocardia sp. NBC_01503]
MNTNDRAVVSAVTDLRDAPLGQLSGQSLPELLSNLAHSSTTGISFSSAMM